jgi:glutamyl-tRNA reductase
LSFPFAIVGANYRELSSTQRAELFAQFSNPKLSGALKSMQAISGSAAIFTCSRAEWVVSAKQPRWTMDLILGFLLKQGFALKQLHHHSGLAAVDYLVHLSLGLDSVAEGEPAVSRQVVKAFQTAHKEGTCDESLRRIWKQLELAINRRRALKLDKRNQGVQTLVVNKLKELNFTDGHVLVWGKGQIGTAVCAALQAAQLSHSSYRRKDVAAFEAALPSAQAVVVCTGAPAPYLELPKVFDAKLCIDLGSPEQVLSAPGWTKIKLDDLLASPLLNLCNTDRKLLEDIAQQTLEVLRAQFTKEARSSTLANISSLKADFMLNELPPLLEGLPQQRSLAIRRAIARLTHDIICIAKESEG